MFKHDKVLGNQNKYIIKVYTEGFRVLLLNGTVIGCKSINVYPIL